jgi:transposase
VGILVPHRRNRKKNRAKDSRKLRHYRKRYKVERFFSWLHNFIRTLVRHEYKALNDLAFVVLGCMKIILRYF